MPTTTTYLGLTSPSLSDAPNGPSAIQGIASQLDTKVGGLILCTSSTRPTGREGATIYETDTALCRTYTGGSWVVKDQVVTSSYTPVLTASTTNPTLGSGSVSQGRYTLWNGNWCAIRGVIQFGTSGVSAGSGQYFIGLPFASNNVGTTVGVAATGTYLARHNSTSVLSSGITYCGGGSTVLSLVHTATNNTITSSAPWTWAASDYIEFSLVYEL